MNWYLAVLKKYAVFSGRASRTEYWMFTLFTVIVSIVLTVVDRAIGTGGVLAGLYSLAVLLPSIGVLIRRLHDTGRTGWWALIALVPIIGGLILLVFMILHSEPDTNQYGPNPKGMPA